MNVPLREAAAAAGGRLVEAARLPETASFATDSRTLAPGQAFVALRGERFDGHAFVAEALQRGALLLVVEDADAVPPGVPAIVVENTTNAYLAFAGVARDCSGARFAAITGSTGKTTTKDFLAQILAASANGPVAATLENENNEIGVAKALLALEPAAAYAVLEMGARHPGDIEPLARAARPHVAVLTNVGDAHLEIFGSREALIATKWAVFATGAAAVLNAADAASRERSAGLAAPARWFAACAAWPPPDAPKRGHLTALVGRNRLVIRENGDALEFAAHPGVTGDHNLWNAAAASAAALALGLAPDAVAAALAGLELPRGRYERMTFGAFTLIYDAYNASMRGSIATLQSFAREPGTRRIAVLGSMAELGADSAEMHERVGAAAAAGGIDVVLAGGDHAEALMRGARSGGLPAERVAAFGTNAEAAAWLRAHVRAGDVVLLKGSRRYKLEEIVREMRESYV
jgi:UDP-N-acetylmuramoyl-tripeptide--D-alanyl-D-alanine ligase